MLYTDWEIYKEVNLNVLSKEDLINIIEDMNEVIESYQDEEDFDIAMDRLSGTGNEQGGCGEWQLTKEDKPIIEEILKYVYDEYEVEEEWLNNLEQAIADFFKWLKS